MCMLCLSCSRRLTSCAIVTGIQTVAVPIWRPSRGDHGRNGSNEEKLKKAIRRTTSNCTAAPPQPPPPPPPREAHMTPTDSLERHEPLGSESYARILKN